MGHVDAVDDQRAGAADRDADAGQRGVLRLGDLEQVGDPIASAPSAVNEPAVWIWFRWTT